MSKVHQIPQFDPNRKRRNPTAGMIDRLFRIVAALRSNERINATDLAVDLECSTKTIYRDITYLRDRLGYAIDFHQEELSFQLVGAPDPRL